MKNSYSQFCRLKPAFLLLCVFAFFAVPFCFGQTNAPGIDVSGAPSLAGVDKPFSDLLAAFGGRYGWLVSVLSFIGSIRVVFKPIMSWIENRVANDPDKLAKLQEFEGGPVFKLIAFLLDYAASIKVKAVLANGKNTGSAMLALGLSLGLLVAGCGTLDPAGVYGSGAVAGQTNATTTVSTAGQLLYDADTTIVTSYDLLHLFVQWEAKNRAVLSKWPEIKKSADEVRVGAPKWVTSAIRLREAFAASPTPDNQASLTNSLARLSGANTAATQIMQTHQVTPPVPAP